MAVNKFFNLLFFLLIIASIANSSPFASFEKLEGLQKGDSTTGINELKTYLKRFGYLENLDETDSDEFDETLESAIKTYQANYNIEATGRLDARTLAKMRAPRCGVPDIIKGKNYMNLSSSRAVVFQPIWPPSKMHLTYKFINGYPEVARLPVELAFRRWAGVTRFTFSESKGGEKADLTIGFYRGDHGDGYPFDGRGGKGLAHAFVPTDGRFHYDIDERWFYLFRTNDAFDLWSVALHEIGHLLGLLHSSDENAVMYPTFDYGESRDLNADDIQKIKDLYDF